MELNQWADPIDSRKMKIMKTSKIFAIALMCLTVLGLTSCFIKSTSDHNYKDSKKLGKVVEKEIEVDAFDSIKVEAGAIQVILLQSEDSLGYSVVARGNEKCLEQYEVFVENGTLRAYLKDDHGKLDFHTPRITLTVTIPHLSRAVLSGACVLRQDSVFHQRQTLYVKTMGASELHFNDLETDALCLDLSGASDVLLGKVNCQGVLEVESSGASDIEGEVTSQCLTARVSGAGDVDLLIHCSSDVMVNASGAADVKLRGQCENLKVEANKYSSDVDVDGLEVSGKKDVPGKD